MEIPMKLQWTLLAAGTLLLTMGAATCAPQREASKVDISRDPIPRSEALTDVREDGGLPPRRGIPLKPAEWQKRPPCDADMGEEAKHGACYVPVARRNPPCGKLLEDEGQCFRAVGKAPREPSSITE